jgi:hypothetical protein
MATDGPFSNLGTFARICGMVHPFDPLIWEGCMCIRRWMSGIGARLSVFVWLGEGSNANLFACAVADGCLRWARPMDLACSPTARHVTWISLQFEEQLVIALLKYRTSCETPSGFG